MKIKAAICLLLIYFAAVHCSDRYLNTSYISDEDLIIRLRWVPSYQSEDNLAVEKGLKWVLSYLGALLPINTIHKTFEWENDRILKLNLATAGFSPKAQQVWRKLLKRYKNSTEYKELGSLDIGRFVMLSFNASWHYYAITGASRTFPEIKNKYNFSENKYFVLPPGRSGVTSGLRIVHTAKADSIFQIAHFAQEGSGQSLSQFNSEEIEVLEIMANGQPRFAVYDKNGHLTAGGNPAISKAGKPAKCMWCHESSLLPPFKVINQYPEELYLYTDLLAISKSQNSILSNHSRHTTPQLDTFRYSQEEHYLGELLYITYLNPTLLRAKNELQHANKSELISKLSVTQSNHHEFKFLKNLVSRSILDSITQYNSLPRVSSRETTEDEINILQSTSK